MYVELCHALVGTSRTEWLMDEAESV